MEDIKYVNFIEISPVIIGIQGVKNSDLAVPVNNTLVHHMAFLAADTRPSVLIDPLNAQSCNKLYCKYKFSHFKLICFLQYQWNKH